MLHGFILPGKILPTSSIVSRNWETVTPHPVVMAKTTAAHRSITSMVLSDDGIIISYGDYTDNLGPVSVIGYNPTTAAPIILFGPCPTEAWARISKINEKIYLPWVDPRVGNQGGYTTNASGSWENVTVGGPDDLIHVFDVIEIDGCLLISGSTPSNISGEGRGLVMRRNPDGAWKKVLIGTSSAALARFYGFRRGANGRVIVQNDAGGLETYETYDGIKWSSAYDSSYGINDTDPTQIVPTVSPGMIPLCALKVGEWLWVAGHNGVVKRIRIS